MKTSKREISTKDTDLQNHRKKRRKKLIYWLIIDLSVAFIIFTLLLYRPSRYNPLDTNSDILESDEVSPYLLQLLSDIHNNSQLNKSFEVVITQEGLNDMITRADWPVESEGVLLYAPAAVFNPDIIILMGTADFQGIEFVITIELMLIIDKQGLLNINIPKIKVGAVNITPLAKIVAKKMYAERLASIEDINIYDLRTKIAASLLNEEPFEPTFEIENDTIRLKKITIEEGKLTAQIIPE